MRINSTGAYASGQATVSSAVKTLSDFGFTAQQIQQAERVYVIVNSNSIRCWWDSAGTNPTTTTGALFSVGLELVGDNGRQLKMIRNGSTDAEVAIILES